MLDPGVVVCSRCQQPNWVPTGSGAGTLDCTHCGAGLAKGFSRPAQSPNRRWFIVLGVAGLVAFLTWRYESSPVSSPVSSPNSPIPTQVSRPPSPVAISEGFVRTSKPKERVVPFQIQTPAGDNYLIKLVNVADENETVLLFVRGGSAFNVNMPVGTYRFRFAAGRTWYGEKIYFGSSTTYWIANKTLSFRKERGVLRPISIELTGQPGGNLGITSLETRLF
jgi:hypothetical protein